MALSQALTRVNRWRDAASAAWLAYLGSDKSDTVVKKTLLALGAALERQGRLREALATYQGLNNVTYDEFAAGRITALRDLGAHSGEAKSAEEACSIAMAALGNHPKDVPFAIAYLFDGSQDRANRIGDAPSNPDRLLTVTLIVPGCVGCTAQTVRPVIDSNRQTTRCAVPRRSRFVRPHLTPPPCRPLIHRPDTFWYIRPSSLQGPCLRWAETW